MVGKSRADLLEAYCAVCGDQTGDHRLDDELLGARYRCVKGEMEAGHVAAIARPSMRNWIHFAAWLARYQALEWLPRKLFFQGATEPYVVTGIAALVLALVGPLWCWWPVLFILVGAFMVWDILVYSASVAFVTQGPRFPVRTIILTVGALLQLGLAFAVLYRALVPPVTLGPQWVVGASHRNLSGAEALYFSFVTMATVGFGDIRPADGAWGAQAVVVAQICVGLVFLACVLATVVTWVNAVPRLKTLDALLRDHAAAEQGVEADEAR